MTPEPNSNRDIQEESRMDRRSLLKMTTAAAGAGALNASALLSRQSAAASRPLGPLPRASYIHLNDGTALFYKDWGAGIPVVFVSSAGLNCDMWAYQMMPFTSHGMRCVAYDRRGHGRSSDPGRGYDFDTLADDLAAVLDSLDLRGVTLVGHSMGCAEISRYLTRHGSSRVVRVALLSPTLPFLLKTADNPDGIGQAMFLATRAQWLRDYPKWLADNTAPFFVAETSEEMKRWGVSMMLETSLQAQIECNVAIAETDFRQELTRIEVPVLLIHGTKDASAPFPLTGQRAAKLIPGCVLKVYEEAPHGLFLTHMERVNQDLTAFMGNAM
jgi:pimeloyl-ACP methyl ester carboxylesterase